jgi:hypothetical protein
VISGKAQSTDPDYIGLSGRPVNVVNLDNADFASTTNNPNLHICGLSVVSERRVNARTWEYTLRAELTNLGNAIAGLNARLERLPLGMRAVENILTFGAVGQGENAKTNDTVIVRSRFQVPANFFRLGRGFRWNVTVLP